jgi:hypothetical protein
MSVGMQFTNPELQAKLEQWVADTGCPAEKLVEELMLDHFDELAQTRKTLDGRYDDIKNGKVRMNPGDEAFARLKAKSEARRKAQE